MNFLYLDIETIPSQLPEVRSRLAKQVTPPGNIKKAESIATWERDKKGAAVDERMEKTSFDGGLGHVCCIGAIHSSLTVDTEHVFNDMDEQKSLEAFAAFLRGFTFPAVIVGHNVNNFDIRFLWQRAICLGVHLPGWFPKDPKPWGEETFDTMTAWAGAKGSISMDNLAFNLGVEGKGDVDGSMVAKMWQDGKHQEIADYCMDDVRKTRTIHEKFIVAGM